MIKSKKLLISTSTVNRRLPVNFIDSDNYLFEQELTKVIGDSYLFFFPKVFIDSSCRLFSWWVKQPYKLQGISSIKSWLKIFFNRKKVYSLNNALILTDQNSGNYFHWLLDVMPKLHVFKSKTFVNGVTLILPYFAQHAYMFSLLKFFPEFQVYPSKRNQILKVKGCYYIEELAQTGNYQPEVISNLKNHLISFINKKPSEQGNKIWISRKKAFKRKIINEDELLLLIENYKWKVVYMEDLDIRGQIQLIASAKALAGMSGAGLSNLLFLEKDKPILEIRYPNDSHTNCFFSLANANGNPYFYLEADPLDPKDNAHDGNVYVNINKFKNALIQIEKYI